MKDKLPDLSELSKTKSSVAASVVVFVVTMGVLVTLVFKKDILDPLFFYLSFVYIFCGGMSLSYVVLAYGSYRLISRHQRSTRELEIALLTKLQENHSEKADKCPGEKQLK